MNDVIQPVSAFTDAAGVLALEHVSNWRSAGYAFVNDLIPATLVDEVRADALDRFPPAAPTATSDFGSGGSFTFPAASEAFNRLVLHENVLTAVSRLLGCPATEIRLTQADLWAKYGKTQVPDDPLDNTDQRIHVDYPNHTLLHPPRWDEPDAVEMIVYLTDGATTGGGTAVVARTGPDDPVYSWPIVMTPGVAGVPWINNRDAAEAHFADVDPAAAATRALLYEREQRVDYGIGSVLLYRHDTWHRGTPINPGCMRVAINLTFRRAHSEWISTLHEGWAWAMYRPGAPFERLLSMASIEQRCALGVPAPGNPVWTCDLCAAVDARYRAYGFDITPYLPPD